MPTSDTKSKVTVILTDKEAQALNDCIRNGYGDGDWLGYLGDRHESAAFGRGWKKLQEAINAARTRNKGKK